MSQYDTYDLWADIDSQLCSPKMAFGNSRNLYPSEASVQYRDEELGELVTEGTCLRKSFWRIKGVTGAPFDAKAEITFELGKAAEKMFVEQCKRKGLWVANNVEFFTTDLGFPLKGELDIILSEPPEGKIYGAEVKTFAGYKARKDIFGNVKEPGFPRMSNLLQTLTYLELFRRIMYCFRLIYLDLETKDRCSFKIELLEQDGIRWPLVEGKTVKLFSVQDIFSRYRQLQQFIERDELPPRDYNHKWSDQKIEKMWSLGRLSKAKYDKYKKGQRVGDWQCAYCSYFLRCNT